MKALPKTIYVRTDGENLIVTDTAEEHAASDRIRVVGVYQLKSKVEVYTELKTEVIVKKSPKKTRTESIPVEHNPLLREMVLVEE